MRERERERERERRIYAFFTREFVSECVWARVYVHSCSHLLSYITSLSSEAQAERAINTTNEDLSPPPPSTTTC